MGVIHRCDHCSKEVTPPSEGGFAPGWLCIFLYPEDPNLIFCSQDHVADFYIARRKPHYPMEKR